MKSLKQFISDQVEAHSKKDNIAELHLCARQLASQLHSAQSSQLIRQHVVSCMGAVVERLKGAEHEAKGALILSREDLKSIVDWQAAIESYKVI